MKQEYVLPEVCVRQGATKPKRYKRRGHYDLRGREVKLSDDQVLHIRLRYWRDLRERKEIYEECLAMGWPVSLFYVGYLLDDKTRRRVRVMPSEMKRAEPRGRNVP